MSPSPLCGMSPWGTAEGNGRGWQGGMLPHQRIPKGSLALNRNNRKHLGVGRRRTHNTFLVLLHDGGRWGSDFHGKAIGSPEGVAVPDDESPWLPVLQQRDGWGREGQSSDLAWREAACPPTPAGTPPVHSKSFATCHLHTLLPGDVWLVPVLGSVLHKLHVGASLGADVCRKGTDGILILMCLICFLLKRGSSEVSAEVSWHSSSGQAARQGLYSQTGWGRARTLKGMCPHYSSCCNRTCCLTLCGASEIQPC